MLDNLASNHKVRGYQLLGPVNSYVFKRAQKYCRVGVVADTIRLAIRELRIRRIPPTRWKSPSLWKLVLSETKTAYCFAFVRRYTRWLAPIAAKTGPVSVAYSVSVL